MRKRGTRSYFSHQFYPNIYHEAIPFRNLLLQRYNSLSSYSLVLNSDYFRLLSLARIRSRSRVKRDVPGKSL